MIKINDLNHESKIPLNQIRNKYDPVIYHSFHNNSITTKNHTDKPFKNNSISNIFTNSTKNNKLNSLFKTSINFSKILSNSKNKTLQNFIYHENYTQNKLKKYKKTDKIIYHLTPTNKIKNEKRLNYSKIYRRNKLNNLLTLKKNEIGNRNLSLNDKKQYDYFPKLLDFNGACLINKKNDKYKDKNILFTNLSEFNFEKEIRNINKKNFITSDRYLSLSPKNSGKFLEKKTSYKILENIHFRFKSPNDKSKLQKYVKSFNLFLSINKFY